MQPSLFSYQDYKDFLRADVKNNATATGYKTRISKAAGCQKSYLSQVLNSHVHLTVDHAAGLSEHWKFDEEETSYFIDLVMFARAGSPALRNIIRQRIEFTQAKKKKMKGRVKNVYEPSRDHHAAFYSTWYVSAIYMLLGQSEFHHIPNISKKLGVEESTVKRVLKELEEMELVKKTRSGWQKTQKDVYLKDSPMRSPYLSAWRQFASVKLQDEAPESIHYTTLFSMSLEDFQKIREMILESIEKSREIAVPSDKEEILMCLNVDFFCV